MPEDVNPAPAPDTPCKHCGLPVGRHPVGHDPWFCCTGCQTVYYVLNESGLADTFYRLKESTADHATNRPAVTVQDSLLFAELDSPEFLDEHTTETDSGCRRTRLYVNGVHCAACVWLVERLPKEIDGVKSARLDLPRSRVTIEWNPSEANLSAAARWLSRFGYAVQPRVHDDAEAAVAEERALLVRVGLSWALAGNVMLIAFALYAGLEDALETDLTRAARWVSLILTIPAIGYGALPFFQRAVASVRDAFRRRSLLHLHMDTPISIGILVGFANSAWATVTGSGEIWFDSITVLIAALLTARWIQFRSKRLAGDAADQLLALIPTSARLVKSDGSIEIVRAASLDEGALVEVPAGEVVPIDGVVAGGRSYLDNAVLTGESEPVAAHMGTNVWAGATNLSETIRVRSTAAGERTKVGKLLSWVSEDRLQRAPVTLLADKLSGYFVAAVLSLAALCAAIWMQIDETAVIANVVALLVITCPCALGMATPLAMAVGMGRAARKGIFVKSESAIQTLTEAQTVILDKTGTLTFGKASLVDHIGSTSSIADAAALEAESTHPVAQALRDFVAPERGAERTSVSDVHVEIGKGISGRVDGRLVAVGRIDWLAATNSVADHFLEAEARFAAAGATPVGVAVDGDVRSVVAVADELRPDAFDLVRELQDRNIAVSLCSGDHEATVRSAADELGISPDRVFARFDPEAKRDYVDKLIQHGETVVMVGDGVNDAAALQRASVGIAVSGSSMAGQISSDVFVTGRGVDAVSALFRASRRIMRTIRLNLGLSLAYNLAGATAAMLGLVTPLVAAVAMPVSSLVVVILSSVQRPFSH